jgi:RecT family
MSLIEISETERKLAGRIKAEVTGSLAVADKAGGVAFVSMDQVLEFAKLMALSSVAVPKHLRGNPGACLAVCIQALEWQMSPFSVANKSYSVNDRLSYEAQLVEAVILRRAPIKGRPKIEYTGDGDARICKIWAELRDEPGEIVSYESPKFGRITPKNSPLWKADPDQQHFYYSVRAWCRRHFPDVLLGVYARDEIDDHPELAAAVGVASRPVPRGLGDKLEALARKPDHDMETGEIIDHEPATTNSAATMDQPAADDAGAGKGAADAPQPSPEPAPADLPSIDYETALAALDGDMAKAATRAVLDTIAEKAREGWMGDAPKAIFKRGWAIYVRHRERIGGDDFPGDRRMAGGR